MPTLQDHITVVKTEIDATGKRLETETLTADQIVEIAKRMSDLGGALNWLQNTEKMVTCITRNGSKVIKTIN